MELCEQKSKALWIRPKCRGYVGRRAPRYGKVREAKPFDTEEEDDLGLAVSLPRLEYTAVDLLRVVGVHLDADMSFVGHHLKVHEACKRRVQVLRRLGHRSRG